MMNNHGDVNSAQCGNGAYNYARWWTYKIQQVILENL